MENKPLIITEKPSAARAIAEALGGFGRAQNYLESNQYYLSWAVGHLVEMAQPEDYDPRWKRWSLDTLPIVPSHFRLKVAARTRGQFQVLARLAQRASYLINACDAGREGELIFREIVAVADVHVPVKRLWVSSLTREAIRRGFAEIKPAAEYDRLYQSALCRSRGDWLVGLNATRAFTTRFGELLSVGRVQTPTLALMVRREQEIRNFRSEPYWEVLAQFGSAVGTTYRGKWFSPESDRLPSGELALAVAERVRAAGRGHVETVTHKEVAERPPQLFDLTSLQREANRRFGLTAAATLKAAQSLYEAKVITYPRTDSRYLTRDLAARVERPLNALAEVATYAPLMDGVEVRRIWSGRVVNDARVTDHHAIIPTGESVPALDGAAARIFDLVARRFLANFYPDARFEDTEVITAVAADRFRSRGRVTRDQGWQAVERPPAPTRTKRGGGEGEGTDEAPPEPLPALHAGVDVAVGQVQVEKKETQPPRRYTEGTLLAAMEHAGRAIEDDALKEAMKGRGLGTPATRAAIIERLKQVGYIDRQGKLLLPTDKGERLVGLAEAAGAQVLLSAELTGEWEKHIADIQAGAYDPDRLLREMQGLAVQVVEQVRRSNATARPQAAAEGEETGPRTRAQRGRSRGAAATAIVQGHALPAGPLPEPVGLSAGVCPRCRGRVEKQIRDWRCTGSGCQLRIPGWLCGKAIGLDLAGVLLREGRTPVVHDFVSPRTGKKFDAYLVLQEWDVGFEFPASRRGRRGAPRRKADAADTADAAGEPAAAGQATRRSTRAPRAAADTPAPPATPARPRSSGKTRRRAPGAAEAED